MSAAYSKCYDPSGATYGVPTFPWRYAPDGYATRRQLRACGLRPGGQDIGAQVMRPRRRGRPPLVAYLYRVDAAKPVRPMTPARWWALAAATKARRICPDCHAVQPYCIPLSLGCCITCAYPEEQQAA
ncbi:hypothetical protein LHJ74_05350 [Streptomyces sp. N2-109]|uniref:Uncharacterized protein n=1 Tax=Streptomyces gossypii TaxID=2883101 RepID=A0ABT2JNB2_9ACTN|nr:RRQRL motif-containing zinc-binding protein [Streptomyces gossypii]MCT2589365.1 hypothetical protein [Streptomyces gossypii]